MNDYYIKRNIIAIDLKSFFASAECVDRGLDPFTTPLVVADPGRGDGAICLAVSPYLKSLGVKSRCRVFEIPKHIKFITAKPRMNLYIAKSKEVVNIYLNYVSDEDLHIYSIDEVFMDVTNYLKLYKMNDYDLSLKILNEIKTKTGLTATCGIGPNILIAKIAMDIEAKHVKNNITKWTYDDIKTKLWNITPLSKMWGIGKNMEINLNNLGLKTIGDVANYSLEKLRKKYGIMGEELWAHANGIDNSKISDYKLLPVEQSYSHSQVLFKDYYDYNIPIIIKEVIEVIAIRLRKNKKTCSLISFGIGYSKNYGGGFSHMQKLDTYTDDENEIFTVCMLMFNKYYEDYPIRKVSVALGKLTDKDSLQLNIFDNPEEVIKKEKGKLAFDEIRDKFGKNSLIKASNLLSDSTAIDRNKKLGGHYVE